MAQLIECSILEAVMDDDTETAQRLLGEMLPGELGALKGHVIKLQRLIESQQTTRIEA